MKWISVKDRLPEKYQAVLAFESEFKTIEFSRFEDDSFVDLESWDDCWGYSASDNITHWMPLPEPPESN